MADTAYSTVDTDKRSHRKVKFEPAGKLEDCEKLCEMENSPSDTGLLSPTLHRADKRKSKGSFKVSESLLSQMFQRNDE